VAAPDTVASVADTDLARMRQIEAEILSRTPEHDLTPTLERIAAVVDLMDSPQRTFPVIHVTGTNGKTSTARMVERLLREFGLRTGRFTSPHLHDIRERIAFDGEPISEERFIATYDEVSPYLAVVDERSSAAGQPRLSYFEVLVAMAYAAFADAPVDVAVIEVGLGGEWDATNVADGKVAVITPIALDHERFLGSTVVEIATEKAGIIKPGAVAVMAQQDVDAAQVLIEKAAEVQATVAREGLEFGVLSRDVAVGGQLVNIRGLGGDYEDLFLPLYGAHQVGNAACALAAVEAFLGGGEQPLEGERIAAGFAGFTSPGRLEVVRRSPTVLVDAAHNPAGAEALVAAVQESFGFDRLVGVVAVLADKDARGMLEILEPLLDEVVITRTTSARALDPEQLGSVAAQVFGADRVHTSAALPDALDLAATLAEAGGSGSPTADGLGGVGVLATGSVTTAAEVRLLLGAG
jgi:dihydrofolate synthase/folylpolyglutamate synthase